jgi:putative ABC transport system permease protein
MFRYLPLIFKSSLRNRRRSILTVGSIAVSLCLLSVLMAMYHALFTGGDQSPAQALRLITHSRVGLATAMPYSFIEKIRPVPGVRDVMLWQWFGGSYKDARDQKNFFARFAVDPSHLFNIYSEIEMPPEQKAEFQHLRTACIVSDELAKKFGWKLGDRITIVGDIFPVTLEFTLVGIYHNPNGSDALFFNKDYMRESLAVTSPMRDIASSFEIQANSPEDVPRVARAIDAMFDNSPEPTKTESERAFQLSFVSFLGNLKLFLLAICGAVTFTILLVSANTISMSVRERVREVGILKTLGFTRSAILGMILGESAIIAVIGGAIGMLGASALCTVVRQAPTGFQSLKMLTVSPSLAALTILIALAIGLVSSLIPAANASRTSILDSLRYSG